MDVDVIREKLKDYVLIRIRQSGICGSDLHLTTKRLEDNEKQLLPGGHEIAGEIVEIPTGHHNFSIGDRVAIEGIGAGKACLKCFYCNNGQWKHCQYPTKDTGGGFAEYMTRKPTGLFKIPDNVDWLDAALVEPLAVAVHGLRYAEMKPNSIVGIVGASTIGLACVGVVKFFGASKVIISAKHKHQAEAAKKMGADIKGVGSGKIIIHGKKELKANIEYSIIPDRIEAGTFLIAGAITSGNVKVINVIPDHLKILIDKLIKAGFHLDISKDTIQIQTKREPFQPVDMVTATYPGFPTDLQAQWMALMTKADGSSTITDAIYPDRFTHISELSRFGAHIQLSGNKAQIQGRDILRGAPVMSTDIRASASLILAALSAEGKSTISRIYHIDRGYEDIENKFISLRADIIRTQE